jgi:DNA-binding FadR family transcriptional regulator
MIDPLPPRPTAVDACTDALRRRILDGELPVGGRLPPERELAASLGASRVTLRSALDRLAEARLISVRHGSGHVVRDFRSDGGPDLLQPLLALVRGAGAAAIVADLLLVRRHLAAAVLERLAGGVSLAALRPVAAAVDRLEVLAIEGADAAALAEADVAVVAALLAASKSPVLQLCTNPILAILRGLPGLREAMFATPESNVLGWRMVIEWARIGDRLAIPLVLAELARRDEATLARLTRRKRS